MIVLCQSGLTPLHVAAFMGHLDIVSLLLQHGCDPNAVTVRGETSLHLAARGVQPDVIRLLLRHGADVDAKAKVGLVTFIVHCALASCGAVYCNWSCLWVCVCVCMFVGVFVCLWVCYHDNSKLRALILTKLGL